MLIVHHLQISQSERTVWLCEELGIEYKLVVHVRGPVLSPPSLKQVPGNDTGTAPFLEDTDAGITLSESGAINDYIIYKYAQGRLALPPSDKHYADYLYWLHYANGTSQPAMIASFFIASSGISDTAYPKPFTDLRLSNNFKLIDNRLKDNKWLAGADFTAADIMNFYPLTTQRYFGPQVSLAAYPNILRWMKDCSERPAFRSYAEKADPQMKILIDAESPKISIAKVGGSQSDLWKKSATKLS